MQSEKDKKNVLSRPSVWFRGVSETIKDLLLDITLEREQRTVLQPSYTKTMARKLCF